MKVDVREIVRLYTMLPEGERAEVADFARFLLARAYTPDTSAVERWLAEAAGAAMAGVTTDGVMCETRSL